MSTQQMRAALYGKLHGAITLELSTIPPYLTALLSIKPGRNVEARDLVLSVMMEEMLHMILAANVLNAIGGTVEFNAKTIPQYPCLLQFDGKGFKDREFELGLERFSEDSIQTFRKIELPDGFAPLSKTLAEQSSMEIGGYTIGEFYSGVIDDLRKLHAACEASGEPFCVPDDSKQVGEEYFWGAGGKPIEVTDLASAERALQQIIDQGEGSGGKLFDGDTEYGQKADLAHYFKFSEVYYGQRYQLTDDPHQPPSGEKFEVDYDAVYPVKGNPKCSDYDANSSLKSLNTQFNRSYTLMLKQLEQGFNGNQRIFYTAIKNGMHELVSTGQMMMQTPISDRADSENGTPTFEWVDLFDETKG